VHVMAIEHVIIHHDSGLGWACQGCAGGLSDSASEFWPHRSGKRHLLILVLLRNDGATPKPSAGTAHHGFARFRLALAGCPWLPPQARPAVP
jgi:hypothetical protein